MNKMLIIGNLGNDPEVRATTNGGRVVSLSVATTEKWKDKNSGEQKEATEWHKVTAFGKLAEIMEKYLTKGSKVFIEGRLQTDKWQDQDGNDRYTTKIIASTLEMLGGTQQSGGTAPAPQESAAPAKDPGAPKIDFDDDIPF